MKLICETPSEPLAQGHPAVLTLRVENSSDGLLVLERAWTDTCRDRPVEWLEHPLGAGVYDAGGDVYRLLRGVPTRSLVPLAKHLVEPGGGCEAFLRVEPLVSGPATVRVKGWLLPEDQVEERVYGTPDLHSRRVVFRRGVDREACASFVVHTGGLEQVEAESTVQVEVTPDAAAEAALAAVGAGARLLLRSRRIGAWVLGEGGRLHLIEGERHVVYGPGVVDLDVLLHLEEAPASEPLKVLFKDQAAYALRDSGQVPLQGDKAQRFLVPAEFWTLLSAVAERGLRVRAEEHSAMAGRGLTVSAG